MDRLQNQPLYSCRIVIVLIYKKMFVYVRLLKLVLSLRKEYTVMDATTGALTPALLLTDRDQLDLSMSR